MSEDKSRKKGIRDWESKKRVIKDALGVFTDRELFESVYPESPRRAAQVVDSARKWKKHRPQSNGDFFNKLARCLGCAAHINGTSIVDSTINEFIGMLPEDRRGRAHQLLGQPSPVAEFASDSSGNSARANERSIILPLDTESPSINAGVRAGVIDTRHYYSNADAAETWSNLVSAEAYPTYGECKDALWTLMQHSDWKKAMSEASPTTAIMLAGGGAPTKDLVLLRCLLDQPLSPLQPIKMIIVDVNLYMLYQSQRFLTRVKHSLDGHERVELVFVQADVLHLRDLGAQSHPVWDPNSRKLFAITGGTIGNLSEQSFFESLNGIAGSGDLLIVSADTLDGIDQESLVKGLTEKYRHAAMQRFVTPGVIAVLDHHQINETVESALKRIDVRVLPNTITRASDVPDSWSVRVVINARGREVTLLSSTRYSVQSLIGFVDSFGWEPICRVSSGRNQHFMQFAFRRR